MRYSKEHKLETHARIVKQASQRLREKGAHGIGVADLMKDVGLTHGGFYAHFSSRDALVMEAVVDGMERSTARWRSFVSDLPPGQRLSAIVDAYLSPRHRDDAGRGCTVAALGADISRAGPDTQAAFSAKLDDMVEMIAEQIAGEPVEARQRAVTALSAMIGGIVMARAVGPGALSDEILRATRTSICGPDSPNANS